MTDKHRKEESITDLAFPPLPIEEWEDTKNTLHLYSQIVGKIRLALFPKMNHWWHVTLYISPRGITTRAIPFKDILFEIEFDFIDHKLIVRSSNGAVKAFSLSDGLAVSGFYRKLFTTLDEIGIKVSIKPMPYDVPFSKEPYRTDSMHKSYDAEYANRFWRILTQIYPVFQEFRGRFIGKSTPVHLFWHSFDLALTRYSGRRAPEMKGGTQADREAYSHEVISFGFWAGDQNARGSAFYSYSYPEPKGLANESLQPRDAKWSTQRGSAMALLMYDDMRKAKDPRKALLRFLESTYHAGAKLANWNVEEFELKSP